MHEFQRKSYEKLMATYTELEQNTIEYCNSFFCSDCILRKSKKLCPRTVYHQLRKMFDGRFGEIINKKEVKK